MFIRILIVGVGAILMVAGLALSARLLWAMSLGPSPGPSDAAERGVFIVALIGGGGVLMFSKIGAKTSGTPG